MGKLAIQILMWSSLTREGYKGFSFRPYVTESGCLVVGGRVGHVIRSGDGNGAAAGTATAAAATVAASAVPLHLLFISF